MNPGAMAFPAKTQALIVAAGAVCLLGCADHATPLPVTDPPVALVVGGRAVDILVVVDNSASSIEAGHYLPGYHEFFRALLDDNGCDARTSDSCRVADVRVGVITTDLGAGPFNYPGCTPGGDGARLMREPRVPGCTLPTNPWLSFSRGQANLPSTSTNDLASFLDAFDCIAGGGPRGGCGFQHQLEAARAALDPQRAINPGFLRDSALEVVAIVTDEDDCSAANPELFRRPADANDPLGPLSSFRCIEFGLECDEPLRPIGDKHNCRPAQHWLVKVDEYVAFLKKLRPARTLFFTLSGPPSPFVVGRDGSVPTMQASCTGISDHAAPAIRLKATAEALGSRGLFNPGGVDACTPVFGPAFKQLSDTILTRMETQCLDAPLITAAGGAICSAGEELAANSVCETSCLDLADCTVQDVGNMDGRHTIPRCPANVVGTNCGGSCPCWRIIRDPKLCDNGSRYAIQVLRQTGLLAPSGSHAIATCRTTTAGWGSAELATARRCQ